MCGCPITNDPLISQSQPKFGSVARVFQTVADRSAFPYKKVGGIFLERKNRSRLLYLPVFHHVCPIGWGLGVRSTEEEGLILKPPREMVPPFLRDVSCKAGFT